MVVLEEVLLAGTQSYSAHDSAASSSKTSRGLKEPAELTLFTQHEGTQRSGQWWLHCTFVTGHICLGGRDAIWWYNINPIRLAHRYLESQQEHGAVICLRSGLLISKQSQIWNSKWNEIFLEWHLSTVPKKLLVPTGQIVSCNISFIMLQFSAWTLKSILFHNLVNTHYVMVI